jgi:hypothetical protein
MIIGVLLIMEAVEACVAIYGDKLADKGIFILIKFK